MNLLAIALGGAVGALSRYFVSQNVHLNYGSFKFPLGTLLVNLAGALLIGFLFAWTELHVLSDEVKGFLTVGFLGALTTFSTFSLETVKLIREGDLLVGSLNITLNVTLSLVMVFLGMRIFTAASNMLG